MAYERKRAERGSKSKGGKRKGVKDLDWILKKKELYRARGKEGVPRDSKCVQSALASATMADFLPLLRQVYCEEPETEVLMGWLTLRFGSHLLLMDGCLPPCWRVSATALATDGRAAVAIVTMPAWRRGMRSAFSFPRQLCPFPLA